ncbi:radical SAM protein [Halorhabdus sp. CBA1104]|uniref:TIGR04347 family pseudo-SAM/SPASM protein n=1 Tax=unclassified Halorhabdus TaxID=2621901 RepID=UPI0012B3C074|nr:MULTISPECIES: TIGR04347 family pseudo-SAM/SPASM protein [unclassified Halorhabdus]QGN07478.1 radical SAM protein [Halorhabdus sp. CBA1104]
MIPVSGLLGGDTDAGATAHRQRGTTIVWHVTGAANLDCSYRRTDAGPGPADGELTTAEGQNLIADLADYGVEVLRLAGGEPLLRDDLEALIESASDAGLETVLETNGTLVTEERAAELETAGLDAVAVAIDGLPERHDEIWGQEGAFDDALAGIEAAQAAQLPVAVKFTITDQSAADMEEVLDLLALEGVERFEFAHLEYDEADVMDFEVDHQAQRRAVRRVCDLTLDAHERGHDVETLLTGNYADAGYVYQYAREELGEDQAADVRDRLEAIGGDQAGEAIADIDYQGNVHLTPDWQHYSLGNVRDRPFSAIWEDESNPILRKLRDREDHVPDRCPNCDYYAMCRGGSRHRALAATGDPWARDPQCYLTDEEIGLEDPSASAD